MADAMKHTPNLPVFALTDCDENHTHFLPGVLKRDYCWGAHTKPST